MREAGRGTDVAAAGSGDGPAPYGRPGGQGEFPGSNRRRTRGGASNPRPHTESSLERGAFRPDPRPGTFPKPAVGEPSMIWADRHTRSGRSRVEIREGRMVHLGYGRYWRSDGIVGLCPIEEDRGPGRRTEVFVSDRTDPIIASRSERSILGDMVHLDDEAFYAEEARNLLTDLLEDLGEVNPVLRRLLVNEVRVNLDVWERRISALLESEGPDPRDHQEDLFGTSR